MRSLVTIVLAVIGLTLVPARPANADGWSAFLAWLSRLDPEHSTGLGVEFSLSCLPKLRASGDSGSNCFLPQDRTKQPTIKVSSALLVANVENQVGKAYVVPTVAVVEWAVDRTGYLHLGAGGGSLHVGGISGGSTTSGLLDLRAIGRFGSHLGVRFDYYRIIPGFGANEFGPNQPKTGQENVYGLSFFVY